MLSMYNIALLVLQSTAFCNIDCSYCYLPDRSRKGQMSDTVLTRVGQEILTSRLWSPSSLLLWHAGEPMSLGIDWYRHAHELIDGGTGRLRKVQFQSNGTLLDQSWIELLKSSGVTVGLSIDGPQWLHDRHRRSRSGRGTFEQVMNAVQMLQQEGIPFTNIATVTRDSLSAADEIFEFFAGIRPVKLAFSIEEAEGANGTSSLYNDEMPLRIEQFFHAIAMRNFSSANPLRIREIESVIASLTAPGRENMLSQECELGRIVAVSAAGDVALYSPELLTTRQFDGRYATVGNIMEQSFEEILAGDALRRQTADIQKGVEACRTRCGYFGFCGGGSPANKYFEAQRFDISETWFCRIAKQAAVRGVLKAITWNAGTPPGSDMQITAMA